MLQNGLPRRTPPKENGDANGHAKKEPVSPRSGRSSASSTPAPKKGGAEDGGGGSAKPTTPKPSTPNGAPGLKQPPGAGAAGAPGLPVPPFGGIPPGFPGGPPLPPGAPPGAAAAAAAAAAAFAAENGYRPPFDPHPALRPPLGIPPGGKP